METARQKVLKQSDYGWDVSRAEQRIRAGAVTPTLAAALSKALCVVALCGNFQICTINCPTTTTTT